MTFETILSVQALEELLDSPNLVVVDCRFDLADPNSGREAFKASRIPGAQFADLDRDLSGPPTTDHGRHPLPTPERMTELLSRLGIDSTKQVVAYDNRNMMVASRLWWMLKYMGHDAVAVLDGGWSAWTKANAPLDSEPFHASPTTKFTGSPRRDLLVVLDEVLGQPMMIDSRAPDRYRGEVEPLDPVAGCIPGAKNFYFMNHLEEAGTLKGEEEIKQNLLDTFEGVPAQDVTFYCGSGVSACVNLLAAAKAGLPMSKLYVGSWSEWSRKMIEQ